MIAGTREVFARMYKTSMVCCRTNKTNVHTKIFCKLIKAVCGCFILYNWYCMNIFTYILTTEIINCNHMYNCFPHCLLCKCLHYRPILQCYFCYLFISAFLISKHPCKLTHSNTLFTNHLLSER